MYQGIKLQPLRLLTGWKISWNRFFEIDLPNLITNDLRDYFDQSMFFAMYYSQDLGKKIGIDLSWGHENEGGKYILQIVHYTEIKFKESYKQIIKIKKDGQTLNYRLEPIFINNTSNWEKPILTTRSRLEIVEKMEEIFYDVATNRSSQFWENCQK